MKLQQRKRVLAHRLDYIIRFNKAWNRAFKERKSLSRAQLNNLGFFK